MNLNEFLGKLDDYKRPMTLLELQKELSELDPLNLDIKEFIQFDQKHYKRNSIHVGSHYEALLLCWRNGQESPIHDHRGSNCGVRIINGIATEVLYEKRMMGIVAARRQEFKAGAVVASADSDIHSIANRDDGGSDLITLHVYSPPLRNMNCYSEVLSPMMAFGSPAI